MTKNTGALNYMPQISPFRACPLLEAICLFTPFPRKRWGIRATEIFDLGLGIFGDAGQEISALRQVRRLKAQSTMQNRFAGMKLQLRRS